MQDASSYRPAPAVAADCRETYQLPESHPGNQDAHTLNVAGLDAGLPFVDIAHASRVHRSSTQHLLLT